jgi:hypothetical protein
MLPVPGRLIWVALVTFVKVLADGVNDPPEEKVLIVSAIGDPKSILTWFGVPVFTVVPLPFTSCLAFGIDADSSMIVTGVLGPLVVHAACPGRPIDNTDIVASNATVARVRRNGCAKIDLHWSDLFSEKTFIVDTPRKDLHLRDRRLPC